MAKEIIDKGLKNRLEEIYGTECTLYYPEKYAGTADCVGVYEGKETIIDFKQSNKPKKVEYIDSWLLQTAAYSLAHNVVYNSNITSCVILVCTIDNLFQEFKIKGPELVTYQNLFLGRLKKFNDLMNLDFLKMDKIVIYDTETTNSTIWGSIIEVGAVVVDKNLKEIGKLNIRGRMPEGEVPSAKALLVNSTSIDLLTKEIIHIMIF